jgi:hypothetical protein
MTIPLSKLRLLVDRLGELKAAIAVLEKEESAIVGKLKEQGNGVYSGTLFDANVFPQTRVTTDWQSLAEEIGYTARQKNKYTTSKDIVYCKVTARH